MNNTPVPEIQTVHPGQPWLLLHEGVPLPWGAVWAALWRALQRLLPWVVPVGLIVVWQIASALGWLSTLVMATAVLAMFASMAF